MLQNKQSLRPGERLLTDLDRAPRPIATTQLNSEEAEIAQLPWMIRLTLTCLAATVIGWLLSNSRFGGLPSLPWVLYAIAYISGGFYSVQEAWNTLKQRQFDVNFLMIIAAIGAALIGQRAEAGVMMFL